MDFFFQCQHLNLPPISRLTPSIKRSWSAPPHAHATAHARHTRWRHARRHSWHAWPLRLRHRWLNTGENTPEGETERAVICWSCWHDFNAFLWCQVFLNLEAFAKNLGWPSNSLHKVEIKRSRDEITVWQVPCEVPRSPLIRYLVEFWWSYSFWKF